MYAIGITEKSFKPGLFSALWLWLWFWFTSRNRYIAGFLDGFCTAAAVFKPFMNVIIKDCYKYYKYKRMNNCSGNACLTGKEIALGTFW
jgi:hypothetical protein